MPEPGSIVDGILTVRLAALGVELSKICEPRDPPKETYLGKPLGRIFTSFVRLSANL